MENLKKINTTFPKKSKQKTKISKITVIRTAVMMLISIFLGQGSFYNVMHPFGFAIIISCSGIYSLFALIGTSIGLIFSHTGIYLFRYLVCAVSLYVIKNRFTSANSRNTNMSFIPFLSCIFICALTAAAVVIPTQSGIEKFLILSAEGIVASFTSLFFRRCVSRINKTDEKSFSEREIVDFFISFAIIIVSLNNIKIFSFQPAVFIAFFAVIFISYILPSMQSVLFCCICGAALSVFPDGAYNFFPLIFAGIVSSFFSPFGKISCAVSFLFSYSACALFSVKENILMNIISVSVCVFIFLIIPEKTYKKLSLILRTSTAVTVENTYRHDVSQKLSLTAKTVDSICSGMNNVSEKLKKIDHIHDRDIFCRTRQNVCDNCENNEKCWKHSFQYTLRGFEEMAKNQQSRKPLDSTAFAKQFLSGCIKQKELRSSLFKGLKRRDEALLEEIRLEEKRKLLSRQMKSFSNVLNDFSHEFSKCPLVDNELSAKIKDVFRSFSIRCTKAICIIGTEGNMTIKAFCRNIENSTDKKKLKSEIEKTALRKFHDPEVTFSDGMTVVIFRQRPWMKMKTAKFQLSGNESPVCGDCIKEITDENSNKTIILSDGMGTGGRAAVDASVTTQYFAELIHGGISPDNALKIINSVLSVKSTNETLSTVDFAKFNLFSGKAEFCKAGAAVSFVRKNGKCTIIESSSLPLGILTDVSFAKEKIMLSKGDIVVMVSDGVTSDSTDWIVKETESFNQSDPEILAKRIAGVACSKNPPDKRDDITVFVGIMTG